MNNINTIDSQLPLGYVKNITSNGGTTLEYSELLLSPDVKIKFMFDKENNQVQFTVEDNNLNIPDLSCAFDSATLKDMITSMRIMHTQLEK